MTPPLAGEWQHVPPPGLSETRHCNVYHRKVENLKAWPPWAPTIIRMRSGSVVNCQLNLTQMSPIWRISLASLDSRILCYSQRNRLRFFPGSSVYISDFSSEYTMILAISVPGGGAQAVPLTQATHLGIVTGTKLSVQPLYDLNRTENSHPFMHQRERCRPRFKLHFRSRRHRLSASTYRPTLSSLEVSP